MKKELKHFYIAKSYGGNQNWFFDLSMRSGGCGALTACDTCICLADTLNKATLYPFNLNNLLKNDYIAFAKLMKSYLPPRNTGIDTLDLFIDEFSNYLDDVGEFQIKLNPVYGETSTAEAAKLLVNQIDLGFPIPFLTLNHKNPNFKFYDWHWYLLTGYESFENQLMVKAATYGDYRWLSFNDLWDTGYQKKGGFIVLNALI